jgi:hypothetical protein
LSLPPAAAELRRVQFLQRSRHADRHCQSSRGDRLAFSFAEGDCHVVPLRQSNRWPFPSAMQSSTAWWQGQGKAAARIASAAIAKAAARKL